MFSVLSILRLTKPKVERPHATWAKDIIDYEHLGKLKSNCCCI
uniref:Uncharacterized protein n=1 Tax=Onchocerca volvulus TaxID=6282 RepID=A0A8R1TX89_ONCVO